MIHFWSLAVEEQFYLCGRCCSAGCSRSRDAWATRRIAFVRTVVALGAVASVVAALHISGTNLNRAYYGTDTRAYQLFAGALLALTPKLFSMGERARRQFDLLGLAGIAAILFLATSGYDTATIRRGIATAIATCAVIIAIENARTGVVAKRLSQPVVAYLGRLSYGTYLWHWPVIFVLTRESSLEAFPTFVVTCFVATALAAASYHLLELRVRRSPRLDRYPLQVIAAGLTLSLLGGLVFVPAILSTKHASVLKINGVWTQALVIGGPRRDYPSLPMRPRRSGSCTVVPARTAPAAARRQQRPDVHPHLHEHREARRPHAVDCGVPLCPWQAGLYYVIGVNDCKVRKDQWYGA